MSLTEQEIIDRFNAKAPTFIRLLGGRFVAMDQAARSCTMEYEVSTDFCHSGDVVQGGFITAMLDAVMSHAVFGMRDGVINLSSLEIKTSYLESTRAGRLRAEGFILRSGYKLAFLEGRLYDQSGTLTATASTVAKLIRKG